MKKEAIQEKISLLFFYLEYGAKFILYLAKGNLKWLWLDFLKMEKNALIIEVYALQNKRLNEKHGEFNPEGSVLSGYSGINKALEIDTRTASRIRILKLGKDENELFTKEVKARTEPYSHLTKKPDMEKILSEKQEKLEGQGLGEIVGIKEDEPEFGEEELKPTESEISAVVGAKDER